MATTEMNCLAGGGRTPVTSNGSYTIASSSSHESVGFEPSVITMNVFYSNTHDWAHTWCFIFDLVENKIYGTTNGADMDDYTSSNFFSVSTDSSGFTISAVDSHFACTGAKYVAVG